MAKIGQEANARKLVESLLLKELSKRDDEAVDTVVDDEDL